MSKKVSQKHKPLIQPNAGQLQSPQKVVSPKAAKYIPGLFANGNAAKVLVSLKMIDYAFQCFSSWTKQEMQLFWHFQDKIHEMTWQQVLETASKGSGKTGLAYTEMNSDLYPQKHRDKIDQDATFFELRVNDKIRVHGFRADFVFFLCWLDRNHDIG